MVVNPPQDQPASEAKTRQVLPSLYNLHEIIVINFLQKI